MYDRANEFFLHNPNLYLGLIVLLGFGPWLVAAPVLGLAAAPAWLILLCVAFPAAAFALNVGVPMSTKEDAYQRRIERNYRLIRVLGGILMCAVAPIVLLFWSSLGVRPGQFALIGSLIGLWAAGHRVRFRWVKPRAEGAAA
jgi:hypothetical protein